MWRCISRLKTPSPGLLPGFPTAPSSNRPKPKPLPSPPAEPPASSVVADFERDRRSFLRRRRWETLAGTLIFSVVLLASLQHSQFFNSDIGGDPLGRIGDFLARMSPRLTSEAL